MVEVKDYKATKRVNIPRINLTLEAGDVVQTFGQTVMVGRKSWTWNWAKALIQEGTLVAAPVALHVAFYEGKVLDYKMVRGQALRNYCPSNLPSGVDPKQVVCVGDIVPSFEEGDNWLAKSPGPHPLAGQMFFPL